MYLLVVVSNSRVAERDCNWWFAAPVCMTPKTNGDNSIWLHANEVFSSFKINVFLKGIKHALRIPFFTLDFPIKWFLYISASLIPG